MGQHLEASIKQIRRFGKLSRYGDNRAWTVAEHRDGSIWYALYRDQTAAVTALMRKQLKGVSAISSRMCPDAYAWGPEQAGTSPTRIAG